MSGFLPTQFEIISDLHLETPFPRGLYSTFKLSSTANYLCLLGDIGLAKDEGLFDFLARILDKDRGLKILYVLGNHESYKMTLDAALEKFEAFAVQKPRFILLNRTRFDVDANTTVLGCTLWTHVPEGHISEVASRLTDFNETGGIREWSIERHVKQHQHDVTWLDEQVASIEQSEPHRHIVVFTHHSPTTDARAKNPRYPDTRVSSGFRTDISKRRCWTSPQVRLWAFGHTHYNCAFEDEVTGKLVVANQKGYEKMGSATASVARLSPVVVKASTSGGTWKLITEEKKQPKRPMEEKRGETAQDSVVSTRAKETGKILPTHWSFSPFARIWKKWQRAKRE